MDFKASIKKVESDVAEDEQKRLGKISWLTEAYSRLARNSNRTGSLFPRATPAAIHSATQTDNHFSKKPMPAGARADTVRKSFVMTLYSLAGHVAAS